MREGRPSVTATTVAALRGLGRAPVDPIASSLVPAVARAAMGLAGHVPRFARSLVTFGLSDHIRLRTKAIDGALRDGLTHGATQVVILGAGLDARAHRMPELARAAVFEVDHPASQVYKRRALGDRPHYAKALHHVPVDFERDNLGTALEDAGHDVIAPTFWIWEGVTMYLGREALRATLRVMRERSMRESQAAVTYMLPRLARFPSVVRGLARLPFRIVGEPLAGVIEAMEFHHELDRAGFEVISDLGSRDWAKRYEPGRRELLLIAEPLVLARVT